MIIDIKDLRQKGVEEKEIEFSFEADNSILTLPNTSFIAPCKVKALLEIFPNEVFLSGSIFFELKTECSRCLKEMTYFGEVEFDEKFLPEHLADEEHFTYLKDRLDTSLFVNEILLTDLPYSIVCSPSCKGICPTCGKNLNDGECGCDND